MLQESNTVEFKRELNNKLESEVISFLNSDTGGTIYIGLEDDGTPNKNFINSDDIQLKIISRIRDNIKPSTIGLFQVTTEYIQGTDVLKILISVGTEKPYYLTSKGMTEEGCFLRVESSMQHMPSTYINSLFARRLHNSITRVESPRQELTFSTLHGYYAGKDLVLNSNFKINLELLTPEGKYNFLAYLLADENVASFRVAKYKGTDKIDLCENNEYGFHCILASVENIINKFKVENPIKTKVTNFKRYEAGLVDSSALREAVINAIVHNDYSYGYTPIFEIYSDRFEILSYGGLVANQSESGMFGGISMPRNRELIRVFRDMNLVEQLGTGMRKILMHYGTEIYTITDNYIKVTLPFRDTDSYLDSLIKRDISATFTSVFESLK